MCPLLAFALERSNNMRYMTYVMAWCLILCIDNKIRPSQAILDEILSMGLDKRIARAVRFLMAADVDSEVKNGGLGGWGSPAPTKPFLIYKVSNAICDDARNGLLGATHASKFTEGEFAVARALRTGVEDRYFERCMDAADVLDEVGVQARPQRRKSGQSGQTRRPSPFSRRRLL